MSAIPNNSLLKLAGDAERWVTVGDLAKAGLKRRSITWACSAGDLQHCHRWTRNPSGGPQILEINLDSPTCPAEYRQAIADAAKPGDATEHGEAHTLTERNLARAAKLAALFEEIDALLALPASGRPSTEKQRIEAFLAGKRAFDASIPSIRSYYRLRKDYHSSGRRLAALADGRALASGGVKAAFDEEAFKFFAGMYLTENRLQATECERKLKHEAAVHGWQVPSLATILRTLRERVPKSEIIRRREGAKQHHDRAQAYIIRDWSQMKANEFWVSDHHLIDVIGIDDLPGRARTGKPARMWLTTWMCEASRYLVGWRVHRGPNAHQVLASFCSAIMTPGNGLPDNIRIDNGKEYRCARFAGGRDWREEVIKLEVNPEALSPVLYDLQITPHYANPYNARAKIVEPWHRHCIKEAFSKHITAGYCGGTPQEKPERLAEIIRHWEKRGGGSGLLPWTTLFDLLCQAIEGYHHKSHEGLGGLTPAFVRAQKLAQISLRLPDERTAALFLEPRIVTCLPGGFLEIDGAHYGLSNLKLIERQGEKLKVRLDEQNAGRVYVYDLNGVYITTAENAGRLAANATREDVKETQRKIARHNKLHRAYADSCIQIHSVDPVVALALQPGPASPPASPSPLPPSPSTYRPDFTPRADDGTRLRLTRPAPDEGNAGILPADIPQVPARMDSPARSTDSGALPDDLLSLLDG